MRLIPADLCRALAANAVRAGASDRFDPPPLVKPFSPLGPATWLATELLADDDTMFGLADLGFGCPELGYFSLSEIAALRLPFGLRILRDHAFTSTVPLSHWAATARRCGSIADAEAALAARPSNPLPPGLPDG